SACDVLTISVGYTVVVPQRGVSPQAAIEQADRALLRVKRRGGDQARHAPPPKPDSELTERRQYARTRDSSPATSSKSATRLERAWPGGSARHEQPSQRRSQG